MADKSKNLCYSSRYSLFINTFKDARLSREKHYNGGSRRLRLRKLQTLNTKHRRKRSETGVSRNQVHLQHQRPKTEKFNKLPPLLRSGKTVPVSRQNHSVPLPRRNSRSKFKTRCRLRANKVVPKETVDLSPTRKASRQTSTRKAPRHQQLPFHLSYAKSQIKKDPLANCRSKLKMRCLRNYKTASQTIKASSLLKRRKRL